MNIAELLGKVLRMSNHRRNSLAGHSHSYTNSHLGSNCPPIMSSINRPLSRGNGSTDGLSNRGRRLLSLETALLDDDDMFFDFRCDGGGIHTGLPPSNGGAHDSSNSSGTCGDIGSAEPSPRTVNRSPVENQGSRNTSRDEQQRQQSEREPQDHHIEISLADARPARPPPVHRKDSAWSGTATMSSSMSEPTDTWSDVGSQDKDSVVTV